MNDEIETTDLETEENDEFKSFNEECCNNVSKIQHSQAISALNICIKYYEEQELPVGDILKLLSFRDIAYRNQNETKLHQMKMSDYLCSKK